jgi:hypothetical protein
MAWRTGTGVGRGMAILRRGWGRVVYPSVYLSHRRQNFMSGFRGTTLCRATLRSAASHPPHQDFMFIPEKRVNPDYSYPGRYGLPQ